MSNELSAELLQLLTEVQERSPVVLTISAGKPNTIASVVPEGIWIETEKSQAAGGGPKLVPAWMIEVAWDHLRSTGTLTAAYLVASDGLNAKRSSAVCALLAQIPGVTVASSRPIELQMDIGRDA